MQHPTLPQGAQMPARAVKSGNYPSSQASQTDRGERHFWPGWLPRRALLHKPATLGRDGVLGRVHRGGCVHLAGVTINVNAAGA